MGAADRVPIPAFIPARICHIQDVLHGPMAHVGYVDEHSHFHHFLIHGTRIGLRGAPYRHYVVVQSPPVYIAGVLMWTVSTVGLGVAVTEEIGPGCEARYGGDVE